MSKYFHSVTLDEEKCLGCTNCIKRCPTEAIRVRDGKAKIIDQRCIDCGECIRICPQHAKLAITDALSSIKNYRYPVALPAPTLYGQFRDNASINKILAGLLQLGFFRVWEVATAAEVVSRISNDYLQNHNLPKPVISSSCPAVVRLIKVRYPELVDNIFPIDSPMEVAASLVKEALVKEGYPREEIGVFFISPCAAKLTAVKNPLGRDASNVDGVIAISEIYGPLYNAINALTDETALQQSSGAGIGWAITGGETRLLQGEGYLAVDGLCNVARVLEDVVMGKLKDLDFIEGLACMGGCVGGPLTIENPFMAKARIKALSAECDEETKTFPDYNEKEFIWTKKLKPQGILKLDDDMLVAMKKMENLATLHKTLPGLDCGACGAPTCRALAEDIVRGQADEIDCIFKLREKITEMAEQMVDLSSKLPASMKTKEDK